MHKIYTKRRFWLFVTPMFLFFLVFMVYPLIAAFVLSFTNYRGIGGITWNNFSNYARLIADKYFWNALTNSLSCAVIMFIFIVPLSFLLALWLNEQSKRNSIYKGIIFASYVIPGVLSALIWYFLLKPNSGLFSAVLTTIGIKSPIWIGSKSGLMSMTSVCLVRAWCHMGFYMSLWQAGLKAIPTDVLEAAELDGCTGAKRIFKIILPIIKDNTATICIFLLTSALKIYEIVYMLTGGGPMHASETIVSYLYTTTFDGMQYGYGMTIAVAEFALAVMISILSLSISKKNED